MDPHNSAAMVGNLRNVRSLAGMVLTTVTLTLTACGSGQQSSPTDDTSRHPTLSAAATATAEPWRSSAAFNPRTAEESGAPLGYYEYLPPGYGDDEPRPLLVVLHGFDGGGDGSEANLPNLFEAGIPALIVNDAWPDDRPFVVLAPQHDNTPPPGGPPEAFAPCDEAEFVGSCVMEIQHSLGSSADNSPCMTPTEVHDFLAFAVASYDVDPDRVYLSGLSCGAFAAYEYAAQYGATEVAAIAVMAGDARWAWETSGCTLGELPIWAFEGDADNVVEPATAIEPIQRLMDCPSPPRQDVVLTIYPGVDHNSWDRTYDLSAGNDVYSWLLGFTRTDD
jgi:predicted peptidase